MANKNIENTSESRLSFERPDCSYLALGSRHDGDPKVGAKMSISEEDAKLIRDSKAGAAMLRDRTLRIG